MEHTPTATHTHAHTHTHTHIHTHNCNTLPLQHTHNWNALPLQHTHNCTTLPLQHTHTTVTHSHCNTHKVTRLRPLLQARFFQCQVGLRAKRHRAAELRVCCTALGSSKSPVRVHECIFYPVCLRCPILPDLVFYCGVVIAGGCGVVVWRIWHCGVTNVAQADVALWCDKCGVANVVRQMWCGKCGVVV